MTAELNHVDRGRYRQIRGTRVIWNHLTERRQRGPSVRLRSRPAQLLTSRTDRSTYTQQQQFHHQGLMVDGLVTRAALIHE